MHWTKVQYTPPSKFLNCPPVLKVSVASRPSRHDTIAMNVKCPRNFPALSTILAALLLSAQGLPLPMLPRWKRTRTKQTSSGYALFFMNQQAVDWINNTHGWEIGTGPSVVLVDKGMARSFTTLPCIAASTPSPLTSAA